MEQKLEQMDDNELFDLMTSDKATAERAFGELYARHSSRVYAYCRRFLGNREEAQDVFQETFVRFFQSAKQGRDMPNLPAFLLKIARNLCVNSRRGVNNTISYEDFMAFQSENRTEKDELLNLIKMAIELLPPEYKDMFILREYEGMSYTEISEMTETSLGTVKIRLFRAKQRLREILAPYLADLEK